MRPPKPHPQLERVTPKRAGHAPVPQQPAAQQNLSRMIERGNLPPDVDLEKLLTTDGPLRATKAQMHPLGMRMTSKVMTNVSPYNRLNGVVLDVAEISKIPGKLNLKDLKEWDWAHRSEPADTSTADTSSFTLYDSKKDKFPPQSQFDRDTRTYAELLDVYSMHEFIIRKGVTLRSTPEFASFKRRYMACWGNVELVIRRLEEFLNSYGIDLAFVDGKKVAELASFQVHDILSCEELLQCLANREVVEPLTNRAGRQYSHGVNGHYLAAQKIQATWRMYINRIAYRHLLVGTRAANIIQRRWALYRSHCMTRKTIKAQKETRLLRWRKTMEEFVQKWPLITKERRLIIHLPSLSCPRFQAKHIPFYFVLQMGQLMRLTDLRDSNVDVVLLAPFRPEPEILDYYHTLLSDAGVRDSHQRLTILVPDVAKRLPEGLSLTRLVLFSSRLMKCLGALCRGRCAYIVPGLIGPEELSFAITLNIPMLGADPSLAQAFGTKSGCRRLLDLADVPMPIGAQKLRNTQELLRALATLMLEHRDVNRWLVKLETEFFSRGHAYFDVNRIRVLKGEDESQKNFDGVLAELKEHVGRRARLVHPNSYPDWDAYAAMFDVVGGCVEAVPNRIKSSLTANLFIEPTGAVHLHSVVEPMLAPAYTVMGCSFPVQIFVPYDEVRDAAISVCKAAFRKCIMGYISVDFVLYEAADESSLRLCAVDVDLYLSNNACAHHLACLITDSSWDSATGTCFLRGMEQNLSYAYSGMIHSPFLSAVRHSSFFSLCHTKGLSFDRERRAGLVFHMVDVLLRGCLGVLSVGKRRSKVMAVMKEFQNLLNLELPKQSEHSSESNFVYFSSAIQQLMRSVVISNKM